MNKKTIIIIIILSFTLFYLSPLDVPYLSGRVNDYANILNDNTISLLENKLAIYEKETTNQVVILIIQSLEGENLEEYSIKTAEKWKLGQKGKDNGVLLLVALEDRKLRIEVGYGLEESLTDIKCGRIIRNKITPYFKANNYEEGLIQGVDSIISVIGGNDNLKEDFQEMKQRVKNKTNFNDSDQLFDTGIGIGMRILLGFFIFGIIGLFTFFGIFGPKGFPAWFLYFFLIPFWAMFPMVIVGVKITLYILFTYLIGFPITRIFLNLSGKKIKWIKKFQNSFKTSGSSSGYSSSSSSSSFSSSSSSFSGGGGSFGGGGASGSW